MGNKERFDVMVHVFFTEEAWNKCAFKINDARDMCPEHHTPWLKRIDEQWATCKTFEDEEENR